MSKQIYAGLEVADHEVRLIVGEFYNTRLPSKYYAISVMSNLNHLIL